MTTKYYIAGPMGGLPKFNYPAFDEAATAVRALGLEALSPAEMDDPETRKLALASETGDLNTFDGPETWGDFLSRDVKIVADICDGVVLLPGWENSRGARLECFIALTVQKPVFLYKFGALVETNAGRLAETIASYVINQGDVSRYVGE
jgi:hypothetical protein